MKSKEKKNHNNKTLMSILCIILLSGCAVAGVMLYEDYNRIPVELKQNEFLYEYGDSIPNKINDYFRVTEKSKLDDCTLKLNIPDTKIIETGNYKGKLTFRGQSISFKIKVQDTTAPEFIEFKDGVQIELNQSKEQLLQYYKAEDLSSSTVDIDDSKVNYANAGRYPITVKAADIHNNQVSREATVEIKAPIVEETVTNKADTVKSNSRSNTSNKFSSKASQNISASEQSPSASSSVLPYSNITIPGVCSQIKLAFGSTQSDVDNNNIVMDNKLAHKPGSGLAILVYGHNTRALKRLYNVNIGDVITIQHEGSSYLYKVTDSVECTTSGSDMTNVHTGKNMLELRTKSEILQIYTCYGSNRWFVKAVRI